MTRSRGIFYRELIKGDAVPPPRVQERLQAAMHDEIVLARYQETKIRHHHELLGKYVNA